MTFTSLPFWTERRNVACLSLVLLDLCLKILLKLHLKEGGNVNRREKNPSLRF